MIVAIAVFQLYEIIVVDTFAYRSRGAEIHRSSFYRNDLASCHEGTVHRSIIVRIHHQQMTGIVACIAFKVKIRVVGHIYNRRFVCFRFVLNIDGIIVRQFHQHFTSDVSRKTFFTVFCTVSQLQFLRIQQFCIKHPVLESLRSAVQTMAVVIAGKLIFYTIQGELSLIDTIGITSDSRTEIRRLADIVLNRIETENNVTHLSVLVGNHH